VALSPENLLFRKADSSTALDASQANLPAPARNDSQERGQAMKNYASIIGAFVGGGIGAVIGTSLHQPAVWLPLGIGIGLAIGIEIKERRKVARS
jgi:uncharacterized membrane protein YoaK (UPF0700 family)